MIISEESKFDSKGEMEDEAWLCMETQVWLYFCIDIRESIT